MSTGTLVEELLGGLEAETRELLDMVTGLSAAQAAVATPAPGWSVHDQIGHLWVFDRVARIALTTPALFGMVRQAAEQDPAWVEGLQEDARALSWRRLLTAFSAEREAMVIELRTAAAAGGRIEWFGPDMGPASFISARTMETWAHGQDCADALGLDHRPTAGLKQVCDLGFRTVGYSFINRGLPAPRAGFRVALEAPDGEQWTWGEQSAANVVSGPALGFALLVTRRRSVGDSKVVATGPDAVPWLRIAQCYAGPAGAGRHDGQFRAIEKVM
ncbi:MAG: TIGR03084 family metal-binding protein [Actinomycetota bacterium]